MRVINAGGSRSPLPVIDISDHVARHGDRGLLGLAVDSAFAVNRYVYLLYTLRDEPARTPGASRRG